MDTLSGLLTTALVAVRVLGVLLAMPVLSAGPMPPALRVLLALIMAVSFRPFVALVPASVWNSNEAMLLLIGREAALGLMMGFTLRVIFVALTLALEVAGMQIGFAMASIFDPVNNVQVSVLSQLGILLMVLVFFGVNLHHDVFAALAESFQQVPIGLPDWDLGGLLDYLLRLMTEVVQIALRLAMPAIVTMLFIHVVLGMVSRVAPQMNLFFNVTFVVNIVAGMVVLTLSLGRYFPAVINLTRSSARHGFGLW